jgi:hypothetical protein
MFTVAFWKAAAERMIRAAVISMTTVQGSATFFFDKHTNWTVLLYAFLSGAVGSLVLSIVGTSGIVGATKGDPSLIK